MAHYLADATVPLHTSQNYDGQLSNQKGLHDLWETLCPQLYIQDYILYQKSEAVFIKDIDSEIWKTLRQSEKLLKNTFESEILASKDFPIDKKWTVQIKNNVEYKKYTSQFAEKYHLLEKQRINDRLLTASKLVTNFWYSAWVLAAKPDLKDIYEENPNLKTKLDKELAAFESNTLIKAKLLRSKNGNN